MSSRDLKQRAAIEFCVKLRKNFTHTFRMMHNAYGPECMSRTQVYKWHKRFLGGGRSLYEQDYPNLPATRRSDVNNQRVLDFLRQYPQATVRCIAAKLDIPKSTVHNILTKHSGMRGFDAKPVILSKKNSLSTTGSIAHKSRDARQLLPSTQPKLSQPPEDPKPAVYFVRKGEVVYSIETVSSPVEPTLDFVPKSEPP